ncbi:TonB-dependent receptor plug domain-containing protein, partial [Ameyamaea chiangmaiensis]
MSLNRLLLAATILSVPASAVTLKAQAATVTSATKATTHGRTRHTATRPAPSTMSAPVAATAAPAPVVAPIARPSRAPADSGEAVIVTGTHAYNRHARDSTAPVTVLSAATLTRTGAVNLADSIVRMDPSITTQTQGSDVGALTSSIRMRGLNPNEVLVLVDGKRRHTTANIIADSGPQQGSTPVDLNMIPASAIDHIEILRDGAAAMYGSDAIAGVVNIILKKTPHGLNMVAQTGANAYNGDGWQYQVGIDGGFGFGDDGYVHISGQVTHTDHMVSRTTDTRSAGGTLFPADSNKIESTPEETRENLAIEFGKTLFEGVQGYGNITYAHRHSEAYENFRPNVTSPGTLLKALYPWGFSPLETLEENDFAATLGLKGDHFLGFDWDLSTTFGQDGDSIGNKHTANSTLYTRTGFTPTTVNAEYYSLSQWTNNLDLRRRFNI